MERLEIRRPPLVAALATLVVAAGLVLAAVPPASASTITTRQTESPTATWIDGEGRQYVVSHLSTLEEDHYDEHVVVARDLPDGTPDPSWGSFDGQAGVREVDLPTSADLATSNGGLITVVTSRTAGAGCVHSCASIGRVDPDGTPHGDPVLIQDAATGAVAAGADGSVLVPASVGSARRWYSSTGADRGVVDVEAGAITDTAVDAQGRLLVAHRGGTITRQTRSGAIDLTTKVACSDLHGEGFVVAPSTGGDIAVACGAPSGGVVRVTTLHGNGAPSWTATGGKGTDPIVSVHAAAVDLAGRIWVGGNGNARVVNGYRVPASSIVETYTAAGRGPEGWRHDGNYGAQGTGVVDDVRRTTNGRLAMAFRDECCFINTLQQDIDDDAVTMATFPTAIGDEAFIQRMYRDLVGRAPTHGEHAQAVADLTAPDGRVALVQDLLETGLAHTIVEPIARQYEAFFHRIPDSGGLLYWVAAARGGMSVAQISSRLADSAEFERDWGKLTASRFVAQLYRSVFGREADPAGLAFWVRQLASHRTDRGRMVVRFTESSEGIRRWLPYVGPVGDGVLLLGRLPTSTESVRWGAGRDPHHDGPAEILPSAEFAARVFA